jgi:nitrite reductase/ring-hydroxylating ferredoxin subunit
MDETIAVDPGAPLGTIAPVVLSGAPCAAIHHAEGWTLIEDRCPHAGCSFANDGGEVADGTTLLCACHGSEFDLRTGAVLQGPAEEPLDVMALEPEGDHLRIAG